MLTGTNKCSVDVKGRINFPAKFRDEIGAKFLVAPWLDGCLIALTEDKFKAMVDVYTATQPVKGRNIARFMYSGAV
ncbi:MAG: MraZ N-terminal domain-containing protein, partial [Oscillospiraceae bacterium]